MRVYGSVMAVSKSVRVCAASSLCKKPMYAFSQFAMYRTVSHPTRREAIWFTSDMAARRFKQTRRGLELRRDGSYLEQQPNTSPRQAGMHGVYTESDIARIFESVQPAYRLVGLLL